MSDETFETDYEYESDQLELETEEEYYGEADLENPLEEVEEMEYAAELLEITDEQELDQFLGKLISKVSRAAGGIIRSPAGKALGGLLKGAAKKALPIAGRAVGTYFGGPAGGAIGGKLASAAGRVFGLELEGLSGEDQEFEVARRFVRLAASATQKAAQAPAGTPPQAAARSAVAAAARRHAPGLLSPTAASLSAAYGGGRARSGRWVRRGRKIIVLGA